MRGNTEGLVRGITGRDYCGGLPRWVKDRDYLEGLPRGISEGIK